MSRVPSGLAALAVAGGATAALSAHLPAATAIGGGALLLGATLLVTEARMYRREVAHD